MWYWVVQEFIVREMPQCFYNNTGILRNNSYDFMSICFANILCFKHHLSKTENKTFHMQICLREFMCLWSFFSSIESKSCAHSLGLLFKSFDTLKNLLETTELLLKKKKKISEWHDSASLVITQALKLPVSCPPLWPCKIISLLLLS